MLSVPLVFTLFNIIYEKLNLLDLNAFFIFKKIECLNGVVLSSFGPQGELVTASKAIIEKEYQPRVVVSKTGPNPFNKFTDQDLEEYRKEVELKQKVPEGKNTLQIADQHTFLLAETDMNAKNVL